MKTSPTLNGNGAHTNGHAKESFAQLAHRLGQKFAIRARQQDEEDRFAKENYQELKAHHVFAALVPVELGGGGKNFAEMAEFLRIIGNYCGSTALALSMHQHLVSGARWKYLHGKGGEAVLRKVAAEQTILVSTGAGDWLDSNGNMEKVAGGYLVTAHKAFASQSVVGGMLMTSAAYDDPEAGPSVLHFPVPFESEGLAVLDDWYTMGMRSTGSCTVKLDKVFVPDAAIALHRPRGIFPPAFNVVLGVAMPLIMAAYVGVAEGAAKLVVDKVKSAPKSRLYTPYLIGEMQNQLTTAQVMYQDMVRLNNNFDFKPEMSLGNEILTRKSVVAKACIQTVSIAMDVLGGQSFQRKLGLERRFRDVQGARFHPLPEKAQHHYSGQMFLNPEA